MFRDLSIAVVAPVLDEERKIADVLRRIPRPPADEVVVVDDGSTDRSAEVARDLGATVLSLGRTLGVGAALRTGFAHALARGYDVIVVIAGNNKDAPEEIPRLLAPIADGEADFVQGSRFLGSAGFGPMPLYRRAATRLHPLLFSLVAGRRVTESTNGFRAIHRRVLGDPRLDLEPALARPLRARTLPLPARHPARLPDRGGSGHQGLSAARARSDEDAADRRLVVDPAAARLGRARTAPAAGAARVIGIAVIGAGHWGPNLIRNFYDNDRSRVVWVCDLDRSRLDAARRRYPGVRLSVDAAEAIADPAVEAVVVATPTRTHHRRVREALERGRHVSSRSRSPLAGPRPRSSRSSPRRRAACCSSTMCSSTIRRWRAPRRTSTPASSAGSTTCPRCARTSARCAST